MMDGGEEGGGGWAEQASRQVRHEPTDHLAYEDGRTSGPPPAWLACELRSSPALHVAVVVAGASPLHGTAHKRERPRRRAIRRKRALWPFRQALMTWG
eukprot:scaffold1315_cov405-Prasinococcus_capsulatus_cf.AAC.7